VGWNGTVFNTNSCKYPVKEYKIMCMQKMRRIKMLVDHKETYG
jgi:hypothetical protein